MALNDVKETVDVLVVGAGAAGLTLAVDLARRGVPALVVERESALFPGSRGKGLQPRTQEVFDDLGVIGAVRAAGGHYPRMLTWTDGAPGDAWDLVTPVEPRPGIPYPAPWMLPQWRTQELLLDRLRQLGGDVAFGVELTELAQDREGVRASLRSAGGSPATVRARYLVGADGGRSTVRAALGVAMTGETVDPRPSLVADLAITGLDRTHWHVWPGDGNPLTLCPLAGTELFQLFAQFPQGSRVDASPAGVRAVIASRTPLTGAAWGEVALGEVAWSSEFRPRAALADRFRSGRVLLAGDAAHVHSPAGGQGLNTGVQDAYNLGWKLGRILRHGAPAELLDSYEAERRPVAAEMLGLTTRLHRAGRDGGPGSVQRGSQTSQLGIGYPNSPLSVERRDGVRGCPPPEDALPEGALRAGDRVPDLAVAGGRLFGLLRGPHALLLAVGRQAPPALGAAGTGVVVHQASPAEAGGELGDAFGEGLFVVRPDGYLGLAGEDAADAAEYLALIGRTAPAG
ncbi:FAD-dependent monooxygenase [Kitasatospora sp. NBC_01287]|uniref:FAD-dependent monooxygenase n=1 Tax=Kitasatospora sp. NBC_01287 TaxID=2903573 RepID=UPI00225AF6D6|nr:FAD-dependent monooxygenase [Kitasatospora sp. NBC_01287]MCX4749472.1 FAD-dependent monooxygenase [Kitasatospora sp. NBC_01287]